jgi:hypothetical protein
VSRAAAALWLGKRAEAGGGGGEVLGVARGPIYSGRRRWSGEEGGSGGRRAVRGVFNGARPLVVVAERGTSGEVDGTSRQAASGAVTWRGRTAERAAGSTARGRAQGRPAVEAGRAHGWSAGGRGPGACAAQGGGARAARRVQQRRAARHAREQGARVRAERGVARARGGGVATGGAARCLATRGACVRVVAWPGRG